MGEETAKIELDLESDLKQAYNQDGVDVSHIRWFLEMTPQGRLEFADRFVEGVLEIRALNAVR